MTLQPNTTLSGRYRVDDFLGRGGMAEVYRVFDLDRSVPLAMKVLHADLAEDRVFVRRFQREGTTLAKLQHPNIVRFYGLEHDERLVFMLMDFIDGITLRTLIYDLNRPFTPDEMLDIVHPVCAALSYAHKEGFVHCDVKPANIMIDKRDKVYVSDFGIARMTESATATMAGTGTPAYMAPEQILGKDPTPQTDIYSLGITMYEMLSGGERPFTGENAKTTGSTAEKVRWEQLHRETPPLSHFNPQVIPALEMVVMKCLQKEPENRYASAIELVQALEAAIPVTSKAEKPHQNRTVKQVRIPDVPLQIPQLADSQKASVIAPSSIEPPLQPVEDGYPALKKKSSAGGKIAAIIGLLILIVGTICVVSSLNNGGKNNPFLNFFSTNTAHFTQLVYPSDTSSSPTKKLPTITATSIYWASPISNVNMRLGPGTSYSIIQSILSGTMIQVIGQSPDGEWVLVKAKDSSNQGWVKLNLLKIDFDLLNIPVSYDFSAPLTQEPVQSTKVPVQSTKEINPTTGQGNVSNYGTVPVTVTNNTSHYMKIVAVGPLTYTIFINAGETQNVQWVPGDYSLTAYINGVNYYASTTYTVNENHAIFTLN